MNSILFLMWLWFGSWTWQPIHTALRLLLLLSFFRPLTWCTWSHLRQSGCCKWMPHCWHCQLTDALNFLLISSKSAEYWFNGAVLELYFGSFKCNDFGYFLKKSSILKFATKSVLAFRVHVELKPPNTKKPKQFWHTDSFLVSVLIQVIIRISFFKQSIYLCLLWLLFLL